MTKQSQDKSISYSALHRKTREAARKVLSEADESVLKQLIILNAGDYSKIPQQVLPIFKVIVGAAVTERLTKIERQRKNATIPERRERPDPVTDSDIVDDGSETLHGEDNRGAS